MGITKTAYPDMTFCTKTDSSGPNTSNQSELDKFDIDINTLIDKYEYLTKLKTNLETNQIDTNTLNRKSYYEATELNRLIWWHRFFYFIYYVLAVVLILVLFLSENQFHLSMYAKGGISIVLLIYPSMVEYILGPFFLLYEFISSFWSKNIYNSL